MAENSNIEWTGSKSQREALRGLFDGRCGYCGQVMEKMHADHIAPVIRVTTDPHGKRLPIADQRMVKSGRNVVGNMMPACGPCNISKGGYGLEEWRALLARSAEIVAREKSIFRAAVRLGIIQVNDAPVVFHFEKARPAPPLSPAPPPILSPTRLAASPREATPMADTHLEWRSLHDWTPPEGTWALLWPGYYGPFTACWIMGEWVLCDAPDLDFATVGAVINPPSEAMEATNG